MFDVYFNPDRPYWKQLAFTALHGLAAGLGMGAGVLIAMVILAWLHLLPK